MRLTDYERAALRDLDRWQAGDPSPLMQVIGLAMKPVDWAVDKVVPHSVMEQASDAIEKFLDVLAEGSQWTFQTETILRDLRGKGVDAETIADLRHAPMDVLDAYAKSLFAENTLLAALEGGGTGLGGALLMVADIPLLFSINLRLIQQIGAVYGLPVTGPEFRPLVIAIYNVAASGSKESKLEAMREISVAAAAFARDVPYKGRVSGTFRDQSRQMPREIAKALLSRKVFQAVPIFGAAVGAGVNYWFTQEVAETAFQLFRSLFLEVKERE
ncbi:MAG: EcsC family protein [Rhodothermales bacterium]|nr:EcsC family protein [Rhodothermales bacterium]